MIHKIKENYSDFSIVSEETYNKENLTDNCFIIDPLDGTINFAHGIPLWGIQVACIKNKKTCAAVIYLPRLNELYYADENGAFLNDKPISVNSWDIHRGIYTVEGPGKINGQFKMKEISMHCRDFFCAAELLKNKTVKLVRYNPGEYWASIPGFVHNTSLQDGSHTTTLKTSSPLQDWYGTGNVINSQLSYYVDSRTKTLDLDQMNYIIKRYDGIVDNQVVEEFNLDQKWNDISKGQTVSPYEVLITPENREQFRALLLQTKNNDLAAFYANLTRQDIDLATRMAYIFRNNVQKALEEALSKNDACDVEKAKKFVKMKNL